VVRRANSQGSGTIIASVEGESLILTAAHVIRNEGPISIELHRYNLGVESRSLGSFPGPWPRRLPVELAAVDAASDLAVLRLRRTITLPFVARLAPGEDEPPTDTVVTSVGIDLGQTLASWKTRMVELAWFEMNDSGAERPFLITEKIPEHGRSGGGLFTAEGELVGVCIGHAELVRGKRMGVFAARQSIRQLLLDHELTGIVARTEAVRQARSHRKPGTSTTSTTTTETAATPEPPAPRPVRGAGAAPGPPRRSVDSAPPTAVPPAPVTPTRAPSPR
jgi:hypothetical protein